MGKLWVQNLLCPSSRLFSSLPLQFNLHIPKKQKQNYFLFGGLCFYSPKSLLCQGLLVDREGVCILYSLWLGRVLQ